MGGVAQLVRVLDCRSSGCGFESRRPRFPKPLPAKLSAAYFFHPDSVEQAESHQTADHSHCIVHPRWARLSRHDVWIRIGYDSAVLILPFFFESNAIAVPHNRLDLRSSFRMTPHPRRSEICIQIRFFQDETL